MRAYTTTGNDHNPRDTDGALIISLMIRRSVRQSAVTIGSTATKIPTTPLARRLSIMIMNTGTTVVYIGNSSVKTTDGFPLYPRAVLPFTVEDSISIYGIAEVSGSVRILEGG